MQKLDMSEGYSIEQKILHVYLNIYHLTKLLE